MANTSRVLALLVRLGAQFILPYNDTKTSISGEMDFFSKGYSKYIVSFAMQKIAKIQLRHKYGF